MAGDPGDSTGDDRPDGHDPCPWCMTWIPAERFGRTPAWRLFRDGVSCYLTCDDCAHIYGIWALGETTEGIGAEPWLCGDPLDPIPPVRAGWSVSLATLATNDGLTGRTPGGAAGSAN